MKKRRGAVMALALLSLLVLTISAAYAATITISDPEVTAGAGSATITAPFQVDEITFDLDLTQDPACISQVRFQVSNVNPNGATFDVYVAILDGGGVILGDGGLDGTTLNNGGWVTIPLTACVDPGAAASITIIGVESQ